MPRRSGGNVPKVSCKKATAHVNRIGDCTGENEICDMWKDQFKTLYNSVPDYGARAAFEHKCLTEQDDNPRYTVSVYDIMDVVSKQSKGKSACPSGLFMESSIYACPELFVHLSLFFSSCVTHGFLPNKFSEVINTPLVKNTGGDLTADANNYRAIALSNADTKILERLMLPQIRPTTLLLLIPLVINISLALSLGIRHHSVQVLLKLLTTMLIRIAICLLASLS